MPTAQITVVIRRPVEEVFSYVTEKRYAGNLNPNLETMEGDSGPMRVGSKWVEVERSGKGTSRIEHEVIRMVPNRRLVLNIREMGILANHVISFEPIKEGTQLTDEFGFTAGGLLKIATPLLYFWGKRFMRSYLNKLREVCEAEVA